MSASLSQLGQALCGCAPGSRVTLRFAEGCLRERRLVTLLVDALERGVARASGLCAPLRPTFLARTCPPPHRNRTSLGMPSAPNLRPIAHASPPHAGTLTLHIPESALAAAGGALRDADVQRLRDAAARSWWARVLPLLSVSRLDDAHMATCALTKLTPDLVRPLLEPRDGQSPCRQPSPPVASCHLSSVPIASYHLASSRRLLPATSHTDPTTLPPPQSFPRPLIPAPHPCRLLRCAPLSSSSPRLAAPPSPCRRLRDMTGRHRRRNARRMQGQTSHDSPSSSREPERDRAEIAPRSHPPRGAC